MFHFDIYRKSTLLVLLAFTIGACAKKEDKLATQTDSDLAYSAESTITTIAGVADSESGASYTFFSPTSRPDFLQTLQAEFPFPKAQAATCTSALLQSCNSGVREANHSACDISGTLLTARGNVRLTYSDNSCSMATSGNSVTRTYDYTLTGVRGAQLRVFSSAATDYRGNTISGGGRLSRAGATSWTLEVLGKNKVLNLAGRTLMSHSIRSLSPSNITGVSLARTQRTLDGGSVEVAHNLAKFTATYSPVNMTWSNGSCRPTGGSLNITYAGSITGSATVTFTPSGATYTRNGTTQSLEFPYCE